MKILVAAGSCPQIVLLQQLKERGYYTILADNNPNAIARPYADEFVKVNIMDAEAMRTVALEKKVDAIIAVCADQVLQVVAQVSEMLGLPCYIDYETACKVSNKGYMKDIFRQNGIPSSRHVFMEELDETKLEGFSYPLVVKPADAYSSKGVRKACNAEELKQFFVEAAQISRTGVVIVEEYVSGAEITADFQIIDGVAHLLSASNTEKVPYENRFLAFRTRYPAAVSPATLERIKEIGQKIATAFHLSNSPMLIQLLTDGEKESVLEFCARNGGGAKYLLIVRATGFDPISGVIDLTFGKSPTLGELKSVSKYITNEFLYGYPGVFDHMEGFEELKSQGILSEYWQFKWQGAEVKSALTSSDRIASITLTANSLDELREKHLKAMNAIRVVSTNGEDILRRDMLPDIEELPVM